MHGTTTGSQKKTNDIGLKKQWKNHYKTEGIVAKR